MIQSGAIVPSAHAKCVRLGHSGVLPPVAYVALHAGLLVRFVAGVLVSFMCVPASGPDQVHRHKQDEDNNVKPILRQELHDPFLHPDSSPAVLSRVKCSGACLPFPKAHYVPVAKSSNSRKISPSLSLIQGAGWMICGPDA